MNVYAVRAIYMYEMARTGRTLFQSIVSPVISTSLYFIVFGAAIGSRITQIDGVSYGSFIVPGLIMLMLLTQSVTNASFGIYFPRFVGTIYELLSAPVSPFEIVLGYVGAAATKSLVLGTIILATSWLFVPIHIAHPVWMISFLVLTAVSFSLFGFILGLWADGFEKLQIVPLLILTPLTFLGGTFYSTSVLPPFWRAVTLFNPLVYLISGEELGRIGHVLAHSRADTLEPDRRLRAAGAAINREVDHRDTPDQIFERDIADLRQHAAVGRIIEIVAEHEIAVWRHRVDRRVVEETIIGESEYGVAHAVRQRFAITLYALNRAVFLGREVVDAFVLDRLPIDLQHAVDHLNAVARQADDPFDEIDRIVLRQPEHDDIAALRFGGEQPAGEQPGRERQRIMRIAVSVFRYENMVADE